MQYSLLARKLEDGQLISSLKENHLKERKLQCLSISYIAETERRLLYAREGYPSLFQYLVKELGYSEATSLKRIQVARLAIKFPEIYSLLEENKVSLTVLMKLAPHLKYSNREMLTSVQGKSVREVEAFLAGQFPKAEVPDEIKPLDSTHVSIYFTADKEFAELLQEAKALLSHKHPKGKLADVFKESLKSLLEQAGRKPKEVKTEAKKETVVELVESEATSREVINSLQMPNRMLKNSRYIPQGVKNTVWQRDEAKCSYVSPEGKACESKHFLEWDHEFPFAMGGRSDDPKNIRLLCKAHNQLAADDYYGHEFIAERIRAKCKTEEQKEKYVSGFDVAMMLQGGLECVKTREKRAFI